MYAGAIAGLNATVTLPDDGIRLGGQTLTLLPDGDGLFDLLRQQINVL